MTPEQIQRLRELESKVGPPGSYGRNLALDYYRGALQDAGPELLDDWEQMWQQTESLLCVGDQLDALLKDVADSPVVHEHHQGKYVEIQVDGPTWQRLRRFRDFDVLDPPNQPVKDS